MSKNLNRFILYGLLIILISLFVTDYLLKHRSFYTIIVDAGSTGTRAHLYYVKQNIFTTTNNRQIQLKAIRKVNIPIHTMFQNANTPEQNIFFRKLLNFSKENLPKNKYKLTDVNVFATGGVRELPHRTQENIVRLGSYFLRHNLKEMQFDYARTKAKIEIISGKKEGLFAWLAVNHLKNKFAKDTKPNVGILELGGASTQVAFLTEPYAKDEFIELHFKQKIFKPYIHSFLNLGLDDIFKTYQETGNAPFCYSLAYPINDTKTGTGDFAKCSTSLQEHLVNTMRLKQCTKIFGDSCTPMGVYLPKQKPEQFFLLSGFYYTFNFLDLANKKTSLAEFKQHAEKVCSTHWEILNPDLKLPEKLKPRACFNAAWVYTLLKSYGFEENQKIFFATQKIGEKNSNWPLGAALYLLHDGKIKT